MASKRHERTTARRAALQVLYTGEIRGASPTAVAQSADCLTEDGVVPEYALSLVRGIETHRAAIDKHLANTSENWSLGRMPIVDRSILRLATYEVMYVDDVPTSVAINEAVELAKDFGGDEESPRFVNGILGRIAKLAEDEGAVSAPAPADAAPAAADGAQPAAGAAGGSLADAFAAEAAPAPAAAPGTEAAEDADAPAGGAGEAVDAR